MMTPERFSISARHRPVKRLAIAILWIALAIVAIAIMATVTYAQSADGWNGTGAGGSWGGDTWIDYAVAILLAALQIYAVIRYGR